MLFTVDLLEAADRADISKNLPKALLKIYKAFGKKLWNSIQAKTYTL